ncbi:MAG: non-ribosomal peptide synthetase [Candidatus Sulfotelmatobacter sp.]
MCVHHLIEAQAKATPDATALISGQTRISYRELDSRANELAYLLRFSGVEKETPVGLCMRRSVELAVGALAILKAGGAYVPLDPSYPANRLRLILQDAKVPLLLTQSGSLAEVPQGPWQRIILPEQATDSSNYSVKPPVTNITPDNLAYIIFTSGSTGRPKGVQISHANVLNLIEWHRNTFGVTPTDKATMHASPGFDASVWELWPHLAAGATVQIVDEAVRTTPEPLRDWMVSNNITISFLPTALAEAVIDLPWPQQARLRVLLTGADTLCHRPPADLPFTLVNNYGPTECTVVATSGRVLCSGDELPSIGSPISNVQVHIVDEHQRPVPQGTAGELLIAGVSVSRGYLNLPELTSEKFIANPFRKRPVSGESEARAYRTGDLGRMLPDGQIVFMGRIDDQIKIRGYRIEPQEISAVLDRHSAVKASCVAASAENSGEKRLVAYLVLSGDVEPRAGELREFLGEHLPEYMIPSTFVRLPELPVSLNGKINRNDLPVPTDLNTLQENVPEGPQSPTEEALATMISGLLRKRVGRNDNFFALGGHSLMGAEMITRIHTAFGIELPLLSLFDGPTVRELSAEIERLIHAKIETMSEDEAQTILSSVPMQSQ